MTRGPLDTSTILLGAVGLVFAAVTAGWAIVHHAADGVRVNRILLSPPAIGRGIHLGPEDLGQRPSGPWREPVSLGLFVDDHGIWWIANRSPQRRVTVWMANGSRHDLNSWRLTTDDRFAVGDAQFTVTAVSKHSLTLQADDGHAARWSAALPFSSGLEVSGATAPPYPSCSDAPQNWAVRQVKAGERRLRQVKLWMSNLLPQAVTRGRVVFSIGGYVNCPERWAIAGLPVGSLQVVWADGGFWLAGGGLADQATVQRAGSGQPALALSNLSLPAGPGGVVGFSIGRTHYQVGVDGERLVLTPQARRDLLPQSMPMVVSTSAKDIGHDVTPLAWIGEGAGWRGLLRDNVGLLATTLGFAVLVATAVLWHHSVQRSSNRAPVVHKLAVISGSLPALTFLALAVTADRTAYGATVLPLTASALWIWTTLCLALSGQRHLVGRAGRLWLLATALAVGGGLTALQLGAGSANDRWLGYIWKYSTSISCAAVALAWVSLVPRWQLYAILAGILDREHGLHRLARIALPGAVLTALGLQLLAGSESGVFGMQPPEPAKFLVCLLLSYLGMHFILWIHLSSAAAQWRRTVFLLACKGAIVGMPIVVVLLLLDDFSPVLILFLISVVWLAACLGLALKAAPQGGPGHWWSLFPLVVLMGFLGIATFGVFHITQQAYGAQEAGLPEAGTVWDRIRVFTEPEMHPNSGAQIIAAYRVLSKVGLLPEGDAPFGMNGPELLVPAVESDFIGTFILARTGIAGAALVIAVQIALLLEMTGLAKDVAGWGGGRPLQRSVSIFLCLLMVCLAAAQALHWLIAWANPLGLLPVIGQPMTWFSVGNSHLLGFALPLMAVTLVTAWLADAVGSEGGCPYPLSPRRSPNRRTGGHAFIKLTNTKPAPAAN